MEQGTDHKPQVLYFRTLSAAEKSGLSSKPFPRATTMILHRQRQTIATTKTIGSNTGNMLRLILL